MSEVSPSPDTDSKPNNLRKARAGTVAAAAIALALFIGGRMSAEKTTRLSPAQIEQANKRYEAALATSNTVSERLNATIGTPHKPAMVEVLNGYIEFKKSTSYAQRNNLLFSPFVLKLGTQQNKLIGSWIGFADNNTDGSIRIDPIAFDSRTMKFIPANTVNESGGVTANAPATDALTLREPVYAASVGGAATPNYTPAMYLPDNIKGAPGFTNPGLIENFGASGFLQPQPH